MRSIEDLIEVDELDQSKIRHRFTHRIVKVKKKPLINTKKDNAKKIRAKYLNLWYLKTDSDQPADDEKNSAYTDDDSTSENNDLADKDPVFELIAQELFRLFIPRQPKTRLVCNQEGDGYYVMSKHVPGYHSLDSLSKDELREGLNTGKYTGLGEILVMALFLNEIDLKFGNVCVNEHNQIVKIDGDRCFARITGFEHAGYSITERDIALLPYIKDYYAYNWLDLIEYEMIGMGKCAPIRKIPKMLDRKISNHPGFRNEVNSAMFKLIIFPEELLADFIASYPVSDADLAEMHEELNDRKEQIMRAAMRNQSFSEFVGSMEAVKIAHEFVEQLKTFNTTGKHVLPMKRHVSRIMQNYLDLRAKIANEVKPRRSSRFKFTLFAEKDNLRRDVEVKTRKRKTI